MVFNLIQRGAVSACSLFLIKWGAHLRGMSRRALCRVLNWPSVGGARSGRGTFCSGAVMGDWARNLDATSLGSCSLVYSRLGSPLALMIEGPSTMQTCDVKSSICLDITKYTLNGYSLVYLTHPFICQLTKVVSTWPEYASLLSCWWKKKNTKPVCITLGNCVIWLHGFNKSRTIEQECHVEGGFTHRGYERV